jgi:ABC-type hemin transport system substrate-binding protein
MRIVSCVPSLSEWIAFLNQESLVGRTRYCIYPSSLDRVPVIGGTKKIVTERIRKLKPDLVVSVEEENVKEQIESLASEFPVLTFRIEDIESALFALEEIGKRISPQKSAQILAQIRASLNQSGLTEIPTLYLIWKKPWMAVGQSTFIHSMMEAMGFSNVLGKLNRYPVLEEHQMADLNPKLVLLPDEPYAFKSSDVQYLKSIFPEARIELVDGSLFSWYSQRMASYPEYARKIRAMAKID